MIYLQFQHFNYFLSFVNIVFRKAIIIHRHRFHFEISFTETPGSFSLTSSMSSQFAHHYYLISNPRTLLFPFRTVFHSPYVFTHVLEGFRLSDSQLLCLIYYFPRAIHFQTFHYFTTPSLYLQI